MKQKYAQIKVEAVIEFHELLDQLERSEEEELLEIMVKHMSECDKLKLLKRIFFELIESGEYQNIKEIIEAAK